MTAEKCVACENDPAAENNPCCVCGRVARTSNELDGLIAMIGRKGFVGTSEWNAILRLLKELSDRRSSETAERPLAELWEIVSENRNGAYDDTAALRLVSSTEAREALKSSDPLLCTGCGRTKAECPRYYPQPPAIACCPDCKHVPAEKTSCCEPAATVEPKGEWHDVECKGKTGASHPAPRSTGAEPLSAPRAAPDVTARPKVYTHGLKLSAADIADITGEARECEKSPDGRHDLNTRQQCRYCWETPVPRSACWCRRCNPEVIATRMIVCPDCGNKRCPRATFHLHNCTGSNDAGQLGSDFQ